MNVYIPALGTKLLLTEPWTFGLYSEYRNGAFINKLREHYVDVPTATPSISYYHSSNLLCGFTLPPQTLLTVKRIYIRQGNKEFDSVTFMAKFDIMSPRTGAVVSLSGRFWVKLDDANHIVAEVVP